MANTRHTRHTRHARTNPRNFWMNQGSLNSSGRDESDGPYLDDVSRKVEALESQMCPKCVADSFYRNYRLFHRN